MANFFKKWERGLGRTRNQVFSGITDIFQGKQKMDDALVDELEALLFEADVGVDSTLILMDALRGKKFEGDAPLDEQVRNRLQSHMTDLLSDVAEPIDMDRKQPYVILVVGVNGTGKTTTIGKLARHYKLAGKKVLLAAADTFRAAACEQLSVWAGRSGVDVVRQAHGADPAAVAYDSLEAAIARGMDVLLVDTAGRLHTQKNLMEELKKIERVLKKRLPEAPHQVLLVLDATTGQNGLRQAELFSQAVGVTHIALTKLDGTARGGIVLAVKHQLGLPVQWVGLGEGIEDLIPFDAENFVKALLGSAELSI